MNRKKQAYYIVINEGKDKDQSKSLAKSIMME